MANTFDPRMIAGVSFFDEASKRQMRYVYQEADHHLAGWILVQNPSGEWMTLRKATEKDISDILTAVVKAHHGRN